MPAKLLPHRAAALPQGKISLAVLAALGAASCMGGDAPDAPSDPSQAENVSASTSPGPGNVVVEQTQQASPNGTLTTPETRPDVAGPDGEDVRQPIDLSAHVPDSAIAYFECASLDALEEAMIRYSVLTGEDLEGATGAAMAAMPLVNVGVDPSKIDRHAPLAIALAPIPGEFFPATIVIAPALQSGPIVSSAAALTARGMKARRVESGYVVIEHVKMSGAEARGGSSVTRGLPEGILRGRFDTQAFVPVLTPLVYACAEDLNERYRLARPKVSASQLRKVDGDAFLNELRRPAEVAFGLELDGDRAGLNVRLIDQGEDDDAAVSADPSGIQETLNELSHHIDFDDPLSLLVGFNKDSAVADLISAWDTLSEAASEGGSTGTSAFGEAALESIGEALEQMLESFRPGAAMSVQFEPAKAHLAIYLAAENSSRAREAISLFLSQCDLETWGFEMALPIRSMLDRTLVEDYSVRFDTRRLDFDRRAKMREGFKTFLGDSTLHLKVASSENHVLILFGGDTAAVNARIRAFDARGLAEIDMVRAIDSIGGSDEATIARTDFVKMFGQLAGLESVSRGHSVADTYREIKREVGDGSAPFVFWTARKSSERLVGATFDLQGLTKAFDAFKGSGL